MKDPWIIAVISLGCINYFLTLRLLVLSQGKLKNAAWDFVEELRLSLSFASTFQKMLPLCGLLGTISGIALIFADSSGDFSLGIGRALLSTEIALALLIPNLAISARLRSRLKRASARLEQQAS